MNTPSMRNHPCSNLFSQDAPTGRPRSVLRFILLLLTAWTLLPIALQSNQDPPALPPDLHPEVNEIAVNLLSGSAIQRADACISLRNFRPAAIKALLPVLASMLGDDEPLKISVPYNPFGGIPTSPGEEAAKTLATLGDDAMAPLCAALVDPIPGKRLAAAAGLGTTRNPLATDALLKQIPNEIQRPVLAKVIEALGQKTDERIGPAIYPLLNENDWEIRKAATEVLIKQATIPPDWIAGLEEILAIAKQKEFEWVLVDAIESKLARVGGPRD